MWHVHAKTIIYSPNCRAIRGNATSSDFPKLTFLQSTYTPYHPFVASHPQHDAFPMLAMVCSPRPWDKLMPTRGTICDSREHFTWVIASNMVQDVRLESTIVQVIETFRGWSNSITVGWSSFQLVNFRIHNTRPDGCPRSAISDGDPTIIRNIIFFCGSRRCVSRQWGSGKLQ